MKLFRPRVFQGNLRSENYFEGWYFKHVSQGLDQVYSIIPGVSLNRINSHAFIQFLDGISGSSMYFEYPLEAFRFRRDRLFVQIGGSVFTDQYIHLEIHDPENDISGRLDYQEQIRYPSSLFSPGIMGWYSFVPRMECKHDVVSVHHRIQGSLNINGGIVDLNGGRGYIEKDWGKSFPEAWIWVQSNNFDHTDASLMISVAKIPWLGSYFIGFLGFLFVRGVFYRFSTYNGSVIKELRYKDREVFIRLGNRNYRLDVNISRKNSGILKAPVMGKMDRIIRESSDSELTVSLSGPPDQVLFSDTGRRAGLEIIEKIFEIVREDLKL
jgi:hypothetical protein